MPWQPFLAACLFSLRYMPLVKKQFLCLGQCVHCDIWAETKETVEHQHTIQKLDDGTLIDDSNVSNETFWSQVLKNGPRQEVLLSEDAKNCRRLCSDGLHLRKHQGPHSRTLV
jgi:hypothetical protein